jgi:hypothetical protein
MALLNKGISKLSQLNIDGDKVWQDKQGNPKGIANIKELATNMVKGEMLVKGDSVMERISTGPDSYVLTSRGSGKIPTWAPAAGQLKYYFPVLMSGLVTNAKVTANQAVAKNAAVTAPLVEVTGDAPGSGLRLLIPPLALTRELLAGITHNQSYVKTVSQSREAGLQMLVDGVVADDGGVQTDETPAAQNAATADMTLLPAVPAVNDAYYFGSRYKASRYWLNISTAGVGNWTLLLEYWNGAWVPTVGEADYTSQFMTAGLHYIQHAPQIDWVQNTVLGLNLYWARYRVTAFNNITTQPKGTQAWWEVIL